MVLGQSPVALPVLLSEVYTHMCPAQKINVFLSKQLLASNPTTSETARSNAIAAAAANAENVNNIAAGVITDGSIIQSAGSADRATDSKGTGTVTNKAKSRPRYRVGVMSGSMDGDVGE